MRTHINATRKKKKNKKTHTQQIFGCLESDIDAWLSDSNPQVFDRIDISYHCASKCSINDASCLDLL